MSRIAFVQRRAPIIALSRVVVGLRRCGRMIGGVGVICIMGFMRMLRAEVILGDIFSVVVGEEGREFGVNISLRR